eukprot:scaffold82912_cov44-Prasinocladus_malaysianus.AAC.1
MWAFIVFSDSVDAANRQNTIGDIHNNENWQGEPIKLQLSKQMYMSYKMTTMRIPVRFGLDWREQDAIKCSPDVSTC